MNRARHLRIAVCWSTLLLCAVAGRAADGVSWSKLGFKITKLMVSVRVEVEAATVATSGLGDAWIDSSDGLAIRPRGRDVLAVRLTTTGAGQSSVLDLWADPFDWAALQRSSVQKGSRLKDHRYRGYRFVDRGVFSLTRYPLPGQAGRPAREWSEVEEEFLPTPRDEWGRVVDGSTLFWIASTVNPTDPEDRAEMRVWLRRGLFYLTLEPRELTQIKVDYQLTSSSGERRVRGLTPVRRYVLAARPLYTDVPQRSFRFAGLSGDIDVYVDVQTRVPVQVSGSLRTLGRGHLKLKEAVLDP